MKKDQKTQPPPLPTKAPPPTKADAKHPAPAKPPKTQPPTAQAVPPPKPTKAEPKTPTSPAELRGKLKKKKLSEAGAKGGKKSGETRRKLASQKKLAASGSSSSTDLSSADVAILLPTDTGIMVDMLSLTLAATVGPKWQFSAPERTQCKLAVDGLLKKYGASIDDYGPELSAAIFLVPYLVTRLMAHDEQEKKEDKPE